MRISDWSSDVCSSDLLLRATGGVGAVAWTVRHPLRVPAIRRVPRRTGGLPDADRHRGLATGGPRPDERPGPNGGADRKSVGEGKSVSVRVDLGGRRILKKKHTIYRHSCSNKRQ